MTSEVAKLMCFRNFTVSKGIAQPPGKLGNEQPSVASRDDRVLDTKGSVERP